VCGRGVALAWMGLALIACNEPTRPKTGTIVVAVDGLPIAATPIQLTGPNAFSTALGATKVFPNLSPGTYTLTANTVRTSTTVFGAPPGTRTIALVAGRRDSTLVHYAAVTGSLSLLLALPGNVTPRVHVRGPHGFDRTVTGSAFITDLEPGSYTVSGDTVSASGYLYVSNPLTRDVMVEASASPARVTLDIIAITGSLTIGIAGVPATTTPNVTVSGPNQFSRTLTTSSTMTGLSPGTYSINAPDVSSDGLTWHVSAGASSTAVVGAGKTATKSLDFVPVAVDGSVLANLRVDGFTLTQVIQRDDNSIPMVSGRGARLRVRVLASAANSARPPVRVRYFLNGTLVDTATIAATVDGVPTARPVDPLTGTWDVVVPSSLVRPGLAIQVEVDPAHQTPQATLADDIYPAGAPQPISVRTGATPTLRLVPIFQSANGLLGDVAGHSPDDYLAFVKRIYPVAGYDVDVRARYTTTGSALDARDTSGAWSRILNELDALRVAEANGGRNYYGIVNVPYATGVAGLGFVDGKTAMGWDHWEPNYLSTPAMILAHELGHNFGRWHSPGCGAGGVDPLYPYASGAIGVTGWDSVSGTLIAPTTADLMSYCHPEWISDYTYGAVFDALAPAAVASATIVGTVVEPCLLVWGRIQNGLPVLEPAFEVRTRSVLPARPGAHALRILSDQGTDMLSLSFDAHRIADLPDASSFAFAIPLKRFAGRQVGELRFRARGREVRSTAPPLAPNPPAIDPELRLTRGPRGLELRWNAQRFPMVMVRDPQGAILSFARDGDASIWSQRSDVELVFSDRVRSTTRRMSATSR